MRWVIVLVMVVGCARAPRREGAPPVEQRPAPALAPVVDGSVALVVAGDPPEPVQPQIECRFNRSVFCQPGQPTDAAFQPSPFERCARTQPAKGGIRMGPDDQARFSALETRTARQRKPGICCYIEFDATACR